MVQGLRYFIEAVVSKGDLAKDKKEKRKVKDGCAAVVEALNAEANGAVDGDEDDEGGLTSGSDFD